MDLKIINHKEFKKIYLTFLILSLLIICGTFVIYKTGFRLFPGSAWVTNSKNILLYGMLGLVILFTTYEQAQRKKLHSMQGFDDKIEFFRNFYQRRLWWHVLSCFVSGILLLLTYRIIFLYISFFDLLMLLLAYPSQTIIRKELKEDELIFN